MILCEGFHPIPNQVHPIRPSSKSEEKKTLPRQNANAESKIPLRTKSPSYPIPSHPIPSQFRPVHLILIGTLTRPINAQIPTAGETEVLEQEAALEVLVGVEDGVEFAGVP